MALPALCSAQRHCWTWAKVVLAMPKIPFLKQGFAIMDQLGYVGCSRNFTAGACPMVVLMVPLPVELAGRQD